MTTLNKSNVKQYDEAKISFFERYLTLWVFLCIITGISLGHFFPNKFQTLGTLEIAQVNLPVAVLIWLMIIPMLLKIDFKALHHLSHINHYTISKSDILKINCSSIAFLDKCISQGTLALQGAYYIM